MPDETQEQSTKQLTSETPAEAAAPETAGSAEPTIDPGENEPVPPAEA